MKKLIIGMDFNPTDEALEGFNGDFKDLKENEIESILEKLRYGLDGFSLKESIEYDTLPGTKVKIDILEENQLTLWGEVKNNSRESSLGDTVISLGELAEILERRKLL